jgi:hypothetical protein
MKLLIKFPTRQRPDKFRNTMKLYQSMLSRKNEYEFVISMDEDDATMNTEPMKKFLRNVPHCSFYYGHSKNKIEAINANLEDKKFDVLLLASDDMIPIVRGYDDIILQHMKRHFPEMDGCLHFNDGRQGENLNTLSIMGYYMYKHFGYIYHPDYYSLFCDNEFMVCTQMLGKVHYVPKVIIRHDWTTYTGADPLHYRNETHYRRDQMLFEQRKQLGFPFESVLDRI